MKKKLLCMLLSVAMAFTTADFSVLALEQAGTTAAEAPEETEETPEGAASKRETKETAETNESGDGKKASENETKVQENEDELLSEGRVSDETVSDGVSSDETKTEADETETDSTDFTEEATDSDSEETADADGNKENAEGAETAPTGTALQADCHTAEEIREFLAQKKAVKTDSVTYAAEPELTAPYGAGALSDATLESAAAMMNQVRFIAGVPYEVTLNEEYSQYSQAAALVNYVNGKMSHDPEQPEDMQEDLYKQGAEGASKSNIAYSGWQAQSLNMTIVDMWMADSGDGNIAHLGHRRWILNPSMGQVGFGAVKGSKGIYSAMYAFDHSGSDKNIFGVAWPAQNMPIEYFNARYPWSVSTGETLEASEIQVTLTRKSDKKAWNFSKDSSDGAFYVDNGGYGQKGCIIFRPNTEDIAAYEDGDTFQVTITKNGESYIDYSVQFFSLEETKEKLTAPKASIADGEAVAKGDKLELTSEEGAAIYYTTDGTKPTADSQKYTEPISIEEDVTIQAVAVKADCEDSDIATFTYTVKEDAPIQCTVTFESNGGTAVPAQTVQENEKAVKPEEPVREGFRFGGWYKEAEFETIWDFEADTVTLDTTLYAKWEEAPAAEVEAYMVSYDLQGHGEQIASVTVVSGEKLAEPAAPTANGYLFGGWYKEPQCVNAWDFSVDTVVSDTVLYAGWIDDLTVTITYIVSYDMQGHGGQIDPAAVDRGEKLAEPKAPTADGYTFAGWYRQAACTSAWNFEKDTVTADTVLYAKWIKNVVTESGAGNVGNAQNQKITLDSENTIIPAIKSKVYDGTAYTPTVKVTFKDGKKKTALMEGVDYIVAYDSKTNVNAGKSKVTITGSGSYQGTIETEFEITKKSIKKLKIVTGGMTVGDKYDNQKTFPPISIYDGTKLLTANKDYTLDYNKDTLTEKKTTSAQVTVNAAEGSNYTGSVKAKLAVYDASETVIKKVTLSKSTIEYTGKAITDKDGIEPTKVEAWDNEAKKYITLEKSDYKVQYQNNVNVGNAAYVIVTGKGKCKGKVAAPFKITAPPAKTTTLTINPISELTYSGKPQKPSVTVMAKMGPEETAEVRKLKLNKDYTVTYGNNLRRNDQAKAKATVQVQGIGNYAGLKANTTFTINPQKISKASVKIKKNPEITNKLDVTLTYNKRQLVEGTDYTLKYNVNEKSNKYQITITGKGDFTDEVTKNIKSPVFSNNKGQQNYYGSGTGWSKPMNSYMVAEKNGKVTRVEYVDGRVWAETYSSDRKLLTQKQIAAELPLFGGFYEGANNYFLVFGANNKKEENPEAEVICIVKYNKSWKKQGAVSLKGSEINGINIAVPFDATSLRMAEYDGKLYVHTGFTQYKTSDGLNHQRNLTLFVDISTMEKIEGLAPYGHLASHSFNQYIIADGSNLLFIDQGDYNPRAIRLMKYTKNDKGALTRTNSVSVLPIGGSYKNNFNATGVFLGGFEASETAYLVAGASVQQNAASYNPGGQRNLFVTSTQKDNVTAEGTTMHWITNYSGGVNVSTPHMVKISNKEFLLMWMEGNQLKCVLLNGSGEPVTEIYSVGGALSDCKPISIGDSVVWYYTNNSAPVFCSLNIAELRK